jgi:predicted permease
MWSSITPDYFRTMQIPVLAGRSFDRNDNRSSTPVAVISQTLAERVFPRANALGQIVDAGFRTPVTIVGVVGNVHHLGMTSDLTSEIYVPFAQFPFPLLCVAIRTEGNPTSLSRSVEKQVWALDGNQAVSFLLPMTDLASESLSTERVLSILLTGFAGLALLMAAVGIYAVVSFGATQRTQEIGVRMALGAKSKDVLALVAGQAAPPVLLGVGVGVVAAVSLMHLLAGLLYGVRPLDPAVFIVAGVVLGGSAALACYLPARRAARTDPMIALRYE